MIRSFTVLCSVLILTSMIYAQTAPEAPAGYRAELTRGSMYTGFHWTPAVDDFNGKLAAIAPTYTQGGTYEQMSLYGINYGYFISTGWAVEGTIDFGSSSSEQDIIEGTGTEKLSATEFGITAMGKYYFQPKFADVAAWIGAALSFGSISATDELTGNANPSKVEVSGTSIGFGLDFGAQYFFAEGFALTANYMLGYLSLNKPEVTQTANNVSTTTKGPSYSKFGTMTGSLGISFYF